MKTRISFSSREKSVRVVELSKGRKHEPKNVRREEYLDVVVSWMIRPENKNKKVKAEILRFGLGRFYAFSFSSECKAIAERIVPGSLNPARQSARFFRTGRFQELN